MEREIARALPGWPRYALLVQIDNLLWALTTAKLRSEIPSAIDPNYDRYDADIGELDRIDHELDRLPPPVTQNIRMDPRIGPGGTTNYVLGHAGDRNISRFEKGDHIDGSAIILSQRDRNAFHMAERPVMSIYRRLRELAARYKIINEDTVVMFDADQYDASSVEGEIGNVRGRRAGIVDVTPETPALTDGSSTSSEPEESGSDFDDSFP